MSSISDIDLDLEKLFQPAWAQEKPAGNRFERFTGNEGAKPERRFSDKPGERRGPRRDNAGGDRRGVSAANLAAAKEVFVAMTGVNAANSPNRRRPCRKSPSRLCPAKTASNRSRTRSR